MKQLRLFPPCILFTFLFFLNIFTVKAEKPSVIFSQLFYDPPYEERMWFEYADSVHHNGEFIELYNLSAKTIDLSGWKIRSVYPREFVFPAGSSIAGYSSLIVAYRNKKTPDFKLSSVFRQIFEYNIIYQNTLFFNNKSDNLTLLDNKFQTMDQLSYGGTRKAVNGQKLELPQCVSLKRNFTDLSFYPKVSRWITDKVAPNKLNATNSNNNFPAIQEVIPYEQPKVRDKSASVGFIDVKTTVSPSGAAVVEIPLTFPSGIRGMEPQLKVTYNSQGGLGTMGYGAEISGLSSITRTAPNIYFEGAYGPLTFDSPLSWDGTRLIPDSTDNNRFHTEAFSQNIIEKTGQGFRITSPDGKTIEYGITDDSRIKGNNPGEILAWKINKITDVYGNYITYTYTEFEGKGSYIHKIAYTGTKTNAPATILSFSYIENLYSPQKKWVDGTMFYAGMLLSDIQVECGNRSFRKYEFAYFDARLFSVIEFTPDGKDRKELELEWGTEKTYDGMEQIANYGKRDFGYFNAGSIYGDGRQDLLRFYIDGENKYLDVISQDTSGRYSSINTTKLKKDTEIRPWFKTKRYCRSQLDRAVDIDNDGQDEIAILTRQKINGLMSYGIEIYNYPIRDINNPTKSIYISSNLPENEKQYLLFYNGDNDNKPEFAFLRDDGRMWLYNSEYELARQPFWFTDNLKSGPDRNITSVLQSDFNGDGITDLLVRYNDRWYISNIGPKAESPFNFDNMNLQLIKYDDYDYASLVDYNNDGLPDILFVSRYMSTKLLINDSNGFHEEEKYVFTHLPNIMQGTLEDAYRQQMDHYEDDSPLPSNLYYYCNDMHLISGDFNNDGLIDYGITTLGRIEPRYQDHNLLRIDFHILLLQRRDHTFEYQLGGNWFNHAKDDSDRIQMIPGDFDLDGNTDIGIAIGNNGEISRYKFKNEGKNKNTLYSVSCNGVKIGSFEYEISAKKNIYSNSQVDATSLNTPLLLVKSQEQPDGIGDVTHIDYSYSGGVRSLTGKGFLGFSKITETTRTDAGIAEKITKSVFDSRNDLPPVITSVTTTSRLNNIDLNTETVLSERFMHDNTKKIYSVRRKKTFSEDHLSNTMVMTQYTYDNLERITLEEQTHGKYLESSSSKTVHLTRTTRYTDYNSRNLPGRKEVVQKHIDDPNSFTLTNTYTYNEQGDLTECRENVSTPAEVSTAYTYTPTGLPASKTTSAENVETIRETYKYSDDCRFLTEKISKETREAFTYDPVMGNKTLSQVFLPGLPAQTTRYEYDSWGRLVKTTDPEGLTWEKQARWCDTSSPFLYETTEKKSGAPDVVTGYDILGRDIYKRTRKEGVTVEAYTQYDAMGRVIKEISGHSQKMDVTENKYDSRGQLSSVKSSDGKEMVYVYDGTTTNFILNGRHYKTVTTDLCGKTRTLEEAGGGPIRYYYHSCGEYIAIRHDDRHIYFTYDEAGRQTGVEDEDTGKKTYGYDAYGRLTSYKDNTSHYTQQYDSLGRLSFKSYMMSSYRYFYTYVASGPGYGLLQKERCNNGTFTYEYDQMRRILKKTINNDNQVYRYSYDSFGRLAAEISPSGLETTYTYDNEGNQISISTNRHGKVWERTESLPGLRKRAIWGNGTISTYDFEEEGNKHILGWILPQSRSP
ncbi:MAG: VCBS repeat-containing protein, partial [Bacteroidales bacterium]|nr:VCBS repeat-containing protein [Bacteroidales bacterium]